VWVDRESSLSKAGISGAGAFGGVAAITAGRARRLLDAVLDRRLEKKPGVLMHNGQERTSRS